MAIRPPHTRGGEPSSVEMLRPWTRAVLHLADGRHADAAPPSQGQIAKAKSPNATATRCGPPPGRSNPACPALRGPGTVSSWCVQRRPSRDSLSSLRLMRWSLALCLAGLAACSSAGQSLPELALPELVLAPSVASRPGM